MWDVCQRGNYGVTQSAGRAGSKEQFVAEALRAQTDKGVTYWLPQGKIWICLDFVCFGFLWGFSLVVLGCFFFFFFNFEETGSTYFPSSQIPAAAGNLDLIR